MLWLLLLLLAWLVTGTACARLCVAVARSAAPEERVARRHALTLPEVAFLSGGPTRVADLTLVSMARERRLLLAHTGWVTVVDPDGRDELERSVIGAIGPYGQSRTAPVRAAAAAADAVRDVAHGLVEAGLAAPRERRTTVAAAVRQVRAAAVLVSLLCLLALLVPGAPSGGTGPTALVGSAFAWFLLPLFLALCCLAAARREVYPYPYSRWATPAGQRLVGAMARRIPPADTHAPLLSFAVHGVRALDEPELRAALTHRGRDRHEMA